MFRLRLMPTVALVGLVMLPATAGAQTDTALSDLLRTLFIQQVVLSKTPGGGGVVAHTPVFANDPRVTDVANLVQQVNQEIGAQISSFPLGSSAGGFTYSFDPATGVFERNTNSFGPSFTDRAVTIGKYRWNFGANYMHARYDTLDGRNLPNGDTKFFLLHEPLNPSSFVEGDVIQAALSMRLTSDVFAMFANFGLSNSLDIGVAVPVVRVAMDVTYDGTILDFATHNVSPGTHVFSNGLKTESFSGSGSASGLGDVVIRAKYNFMRRPGGGLAAAVDLRLPTGDDTNLLGVGATQAKIFLIASRSIGRVSPHLNVGYTISGTGHAFAVGDQANYAGGVEVAASPRVTLVGDILGRTDRNVFRLVDSPQLHTFQQGNSAPTETTTLPEVATSLGNLTTAIAVVGGKLNPWQNLLISAQVLVPLNNTGLRARVTPVVGFEYAF